MQLELYQIETARIASQQSALLAQARVMLEQNHSLFPLEQSGVLHALQILIENAIGKAKQWLKAQNKSVPISGYDAFSALAQYGLIAQTDLSDWIAIIGLRNRIVHDYMNIDMNQVLALVVTGKEKFITDFLLKDMAL